MISKVSSSSDIPAFFSGKTRGPSEEQRKPEGLASLASTISNRGRLEASGKSKRIPGRLEPHGSPSLGRGEEVEEGVMTRTTGLPSQLTRPNKRVKNPFSGWGNQASAKNPE